MANKFYGKVGYGIKTVQTSPGVFTEEIEERFYYGDVIKNSSRLMDGISLNSDVVLENRIRILADAFAFAMYYRIRYVEYRGILWTVKSVLIESPRLVLTLGEMYNKQKT